MKRSVLALLAVLAVVALGCAHPAHAHFYAGCLKRPCKKHVIGPYNASLVRIHRCESPGDWFYNGGSGFDGGLQFSPRTWSSLGSRFAYAWQAPILEQKYRAVILWVRVGTPHSTGTWPHCGAYA